MQTQRVLKLFQIVLLLAIVVSMMTSRGLAASPKDAAQTQPAASALPGSTGQTGQQYVGAETCKSCHEDIYKQFETTPHYKTLLDTRAGPAHQGCEGCHGPGAEHVAAGGDPTKIFTFKGVSARTISNRCLECHSKDQQRANFRRSAHELSSVACTDCHSPHHPKSEGGQYLLAKPQPDLCYGCHQEMRSQFMRPFRHRIESGLLVCNDCHNEHGAFLPKMLRWSANQDQVCFKCHTDKQGPFVFEHVPVKTEGCTICHFPHGSNNPHMIKRAQVNQLCLECHTAGGVIGAPGPIGPGHNQAQKYQACTMCHTQIHGSNTSAVFFR